MQIIDELMKRPKRDDSIFVGFHCNPILHDEFMEFSNKYGYGAKRRIIETALKEFLDKQKDR